MYKLFSIVFVGIVFISSTVQAKEDAIYHAFGETVIQVSRNIEIDTCTKMVSSLIQLSRTMGQMIAENIQTECDDLIEVALPKVRNITKMELDTIVYEEGSKIELEPVVIKVYPDTQMEMIRLWAAERILYVDDIQGNLLEALDKYDIGYQPSNSRKSKDIIARMKAGKQIIIFKEKAELLPVIIAGKNKVIVEMPFLEGLIDNPAKQKMLSDLFLELKQPKEKEE